MEEIKALCGRVVAEALTMHQLSYKDGFNDGYGAGYEAARPKYSDGKKLVIPFEDENFGNVLALAVRQSLRETETAMQMIHFLMPMLQYFSYRTLWMFDRDVSGYIQNGSSETTDLWKKFVVHVRVQLNHKKP